jgi:hypothetical protein
MTKYQKPLLALALALSVGSVYAQGTAGGQGGGSTADKPETNTFQSWLNTHSAKNNGRVSRQVYMDEAGRRWDSMDQNKVGLTTEEINRIYYNPSARLGGPTATGSGEKKGVQQ